MSLDNSQFSETVGTFGRMSFKYAPGTVDIIFRYTSGVIFSCERVFGTWWFMHEMVVLVRF